MKAGVSILIKAVIFDMYETLITYYGCPLYFGAQMAKDIGIAEDDFQRIWRPSEEKRTIGKMTLEETLEKIMIQNNCFSKKILDYVVHKRVETKRSLFEHLHKEILPMLKNLKKQGIQKPEAEIYRRCMDTLGVEARECLYVGDGGSDELEAARTFGMKAVQAVWYFDEEKMQTKAVNYEFKQIARPMDVLGETLN